MSWLPKKCVVVPIDFSEESFGAVDAALSMVETPTQIHVIHVLPVLSPGEPGVMWDTLNDESRNQHAVEQLTGRLSDPKYQGIHVTSVVGDPGHQVADHAAALSAELIVMPSHGRTGLTRLLIGSVAERVIRLAHCPVLVMRK